MRFSPGARLLLAALLAVSLGTKAAVSRPAGRDGGTDVAAAATALIGGAGYAATIEKRPFATLVHGRRGDCQLLVAEYPVHGTIAEPLTTLAAPVGPLRFVWRGEIHDTAPKAAPLMHFYVRRELRRIGLAPDHLPIIAVAASPACPSRPVDWRALAALPA